MSKTNEKSSSSSSAAAAAGAAAAPAAASAPAKVAPVSFDEKKLVLNAVKFDEKEYVTLLGAMVGHAQKLQNAPGLGLIPQEDLVADLVVAALAPHSGTNGPLKVRKVTYKAGRSNVVIEYPADPTLAAGKDKVVSFVGAHMDVVPADPAVWKKANPFKLTVDGDLLYGRGVTDCLGHVALLTCLFKQLAINKPKLAVSVMGVAISNEEASSELGIGVDELVKQGELERAKSGPLFWVDSADFGPTLGTGGALTWELTTTGKLFHSGFPHKAINPIELGMEVVKYLQDRFYKDFPAGKQEEAYKFETGSSLKPTQISCPPGGTNQIPGSCTISGDIRLTPFFDVDAVKAKVAQYVAELDVTTLPFRGWSRYELKQEGLKGGVALKWLGHPYKGVACNLQSLGYRALHNAIEHVRQEAKPFSLTGSLPCIRDLQDAGFDVQVMGFGRMSSYHANDECGSLKEFGQGFAVLARIVDTLNQAL